MKNPPRVFLGFALSSSRATIHHSQCLWMADEVNWVARSKAVSSVNRL